MLPLIAYIRSVSEKVADVMIHVGLANVFHKLTLIDVLLIAIPAVLISRAAKKLENSPRLTSKNTKTSIG